MILFYKICALALSCLAAWSDWKTFKVSNNLLICFLTAAVASRLIMADAGGIADCIVGLILPFIILWVFYRFRKIGAGDIKLFCVLGAFMGPGSILWCMFCSFLCGGVLAVMEFLASGKDPAVVTSKVHVAVLTVPAVIMWVAGLY